MRCRRRKQGNGKLEEEEEEGEEGIRVL